MSTNFNNLKQFWCTVIGIYIFLKVSVMKKMLIELYDSNFDLLLKKEKRLIELKNQSKDDNTSTIFKVKDYTIFNLLVITKCFCFLGEKSRTGQINNRVWINESQKY